MQILRSCKRFIWSSVTDNLNESCKYFENKYENVKWTVCPKIDTVYQNKVTAWVIGRCDNSPIIRSLKQERKIIMKWKNMPLSHKIATIIAGLAVVVWLIHQVKPTLFPVDPTYPAIAVVTFCEAVVCWKENRKWACLLIVGAVICIASFLLGLMLL